MSDFWQDVRYGARMLRLRKGFTAVAVLTLALGIGANTAIFSAVNGIMLQTLPVGHPDRLVLFSDNPSEGTTDGDPSDDVWSRFSLPSFRYFAEHLPAFQDLAAFRSGESAVSVVGEGRGEGAAQLATAHLVTGNYFAVLEASPLVGRTLTPADDDQGAAPAAVVSYGYWQGRLGADPSAVGRTVQINGQPYTIVGVMPRAFYGERVRRAADFWIPLHFQPLVERRASYLTARDTYWLNIVGRLKPGLALRQAQAQVDVALRQYLTDQAGPQPSEEWSRAIARGRVRLARGERGISGLRTNYADSLRVLAVVAAFVLLIACANIANLLLSRATARSGEVGMRLALGATRWRLVRQLLTESVLLGLLGGAAGFGLALAGVRALKDFVSRSAPVDVGISLPVLGFTMGVSLVAGVLFGLAPAWRAGRTDLATAMRARTEKGGGRLRPGLAPGLVAVQVALSLVLLAGAGLLVRSLRNLAREDVGFARDGVMLVGINLRVSGLDTAALPGYYRRLIDRVSAVPGVRAATVATYSPMSGSRSTSNITVEGFTPPPSEDMLVDVDIVGPHYADVLGLPVLQGRQFDDRDGRGSSDIAVVNEAFARAFLQGRNPIGVRFGFGDKPADATIQIVGVVGDMKFEGPRAEPRRMVFLPMFQTSGEFAYNSELEVRTAGPPEPLVAAVRQAVAEVDTRVPIARVRTLAEQVGDSMAREQLLTRLVTGFGILAVILACVGLYGVISQMVAARTNELGIRMALGAERGDILKMVLRDAGVLTGLGVVLGVPGGLAAARLIRNQLFGIGPADPLTLVASTVLLVAVALLAGYLPARRASRVEPVTALRSE